MGKSKKRAKAPTPRATSETATPNGRILVCMPFSDDHSEDLLDTLKGHCRALGLTLERADQLASSKDILTNITQGIDVAEAVIVDLTGCNSNVMYELGILDSQDKPALLLARNGSSLCANIRSRRYINFDNLSSTEGRRRLINEIDRWLKKSGVVRPDTIIKGKLDRTKAIVASLHDLLRRDPSEFGPFSLRFSGGLSAIAISDDELRLDRENAQAKEAEYLEELSKERDLLIEAASRGHRMRCLIYSPATEHEIILGSKLTRRIAHLAKFLGDRQQTAANNNIEWKIATYRPSNIYIIGDEVAYEGFKKDGSRGYPLTLRTLDKHAIRDRSRLFDNLFDATTDRPSPVDGSRPENLRRATLDQLRNVLKKVSRIDAQASKRSDVPKGRRKKKGRKAPKKKQ